MAEVKEIDLNLILTDPEIQPREWLEKKPLQALTQLLQEDGAEAVPPIAVFYDAENDVHWLADGHYRVGAAREALNKGGPSALWAEVHEGTKREAFIFAAGANKHGTQLTDQEKRRVVERLLNDAEWKEKSARIIALYIGVSNGFVSAIRRELEAQSASVHDTQVEPTTVIYERRGKKHRMKKGNIGRSRGAQTKTARTTTPPDSPAITQYERPTDEDDTPQIDDSREVVEADTTTSINDPKVVLESNSNDTLEAVTNDAAYELDDGRESAAYQEAVTTEGFKYLQVAWEAATDEERHAFLLWIKTDEDQKRWNHALGPTLKSFTMTRDHMH